MVATSITWQQYIQVTSPKLTSGPRQKELVLAHPLSVTRDWRIIPRTVVMAFQSKLVSMRPIHAKAILRQLTGWSLVSRPGYRPTTRNIVCHGQEPSLWVTFDRNLAAESLIVRPANLTNASRGGGVDDAVVRKRRTDHMDMPSTYSPRAAWERNEYS